MRAIIDAGYELEGKTFNKEVEDVLQGRNHKVADMIVAFIKLHCNVGYAHVVLLEAMYFQIMKEVLLGQSAKITDLQKTKEAYEEAMNDVLQHDQDKGLMKSLYKSINNDKLRLSPEDIANELKEKGKVELSDE